MHLRKDLFEFRFQSIKTIYKIIITSLPPVEFSR